MKLYHVYKTTGRTNWAIPLYKYSNGIIYLYSNNNSITYDSESGEWNEDSDIDLSLISDKQQQIVIGIIFRHPSIFKYKNA